MPHSRHKIAFTLPLRDVRLNDGSEPLISERKFRQLLEDQFRKGYEAGERSLSEQLITQRQQLAEIQAGVLRSLEKALPGVIAEWEKSLVLLALESARRVVYDTPIDAHMIEKTVSAALGELKETADYEVLLHPEDLALLSQVQSGMLPPADSKRIQFSPDPRVTRGDCVVKTRHGSIAATRELIFEKMESAVLC